MHDLDRMLQLQLEGNHAEAREISDKLEALGEENILDADGKNTADIWMRHSFNRGWFLLQEGKYQEGSQRLENGRFLSVYGSPPIQSTKPLFNPNEHDINGKTIIIAMEGGLGDEIIHARFATSFKRNGAGSVILAASSELATLLGRIEGVDRVIDRSDVPSVEHDFWLPGFSAGWVAGHDFDTLPSDAYLTALPDSVSMWSSIIPKSPRPNIGIRWAGNPKFEHQQFRRFPVEFMTNLSAYSDQLSIYSIQRDHNTTTLPDGIVDLQSLLISWEDTAAAISNLDLVITSCTSVAHLAAALGKETWVMVPCLPYHTWAYKSPDSITTPYYKSVRIFRQKQSGKWNDVFQEMYKALEERYDLPHQKLNDEDKPANKLNIGCGIRKAPGYFNIDDRPSVNPDAVVDYTKTLPCDDSTYTHIALDGILSTLDSEQALHLIKEMYRVSDNGALWEIRVPHWRSDEAHAPTNKSIISPQFFQQLDQQLLMDEQLQKRNNQALLSYAHNIDVSMLDIKYDYMPYWKMKINANEITTEELQFSLTHLNNVASHVIYLVQVHKPQRYNINEFDDAIAALCVK